MRIFGFAIGHTRFYSLHKGCAIDAIARIGRVDRDTLSLWIDNWEEFGFNGLEDDERRGRAAIDCLESRKSGSNSDAESTISASFGQINHAINRAANCPTGKPVETS